MENVSLATPVVELPRSFLILDRIVSVLHYLGGILLAGMMLLTGFDVIGRAFFNSPIKGTQEISELLLVLIVFFGVAYTALQKEHVRVELLIMHLSQKVQLIFELFSSLISIALVSAIAVEGFDQMIVLKQRFMTTTLLKLPLWPIALMLAAGAFLLVLVLIRDLYVLLRKTSDHAWRMQDWLVPCLAVVIIGMGVVWGWGAETRLSPTAVGGLGMGIMLLLLFIGVPIGYCMAIVGTVGMMYLLNTAAGLTMLQTTPFDTTSNYSLTVVPLFILMGAIAFHSGISTDLYTMVYRWFGHLPGGLAVATVGACAGFAAVSGSSLATAATMGMVALPEMKRYNYDPALATGALAAGGTMGILIPPSVVMIIYGFLTTQPIGTLFMAGFVPGILQAVLYMMTIFIICKIRPELGPPGQRSTYRERFLSMRDTWGVVVLFVLVLGGLYLGIFTPTEAGGVGAFGALIFIILRRRFNLKSISGSLNSSVKTTSMSFVVLIGAMCLGYFLTITQIPLLLSDFVSNLPLNRYLILIMIVVVYLLLGCVMDSLSIVLITVPIFFPVVQTLGFDPIWFGIIMVRVVEIGMITPPVGINVFVIKGVAGDVPMHTIFRGIAPFLVADVIHVVLLIAIPDISLFLPRLLGM